MKRTLPLVLLAACGAAETPRASAPPPTIHPYAASESDVNAYVLSDDTGTILIDATRNSSDARALLELARTTGRDPSLVFVTHGHPDHFWGLAALREEVPDLRIVVASQAIKQDMLGFSTWAAGEGWMEKEPGMKPDAFDYASIEVLPSDELRLPGGAVLQVKSDYAATEAAHETTLYSEELGALFTGDLAYEGVHLWLGVGVTPEAAREWQRTLSALEAAYPPSTKVYPGHGPVTDRGVFARDRQYIDDLLAAAKAPSDEVAIAEMVAKYPDWKNREFLLAMSVANQRQLATAATPPAP
jgi:glyoxylase-like metal-dependent hydrolase (beta-lactamase superfamily II)